MEFMMYPTFEVVSEVGVIPRIRLPKNYIDLVKVFYEEDGKEEFEDYVHGLRRSIAGSSLDMNIRLNCDDEKGLVHISVGPSGGLDLNEEGLPGFQTLNLGGCGINSFIAGAVAQKYVSELLRGN